MNYSLFNIIIFQIYIYNIEFMDIISLNELEFKNLTFKKTKNSAKKILNYLVLSQKKKIKIILKSVLIPFGYEFFNGHNILNVEINPNKNNEHYNMYVCINRFEDIFKILYDSDYCPENLKQDIENKGYYNNMRESKEGYIIRCYVIGMPKIYTKNGGNEILLTHKDVKNTVSNIEIDFGILWISENNYGILWYIKEIEIIHFRK